MTTKAELKEELFDFVMNYNKVEFQSKKKWYEKRDKKSEYVCSTLKPVIERLENLLKTESYDLKALKMFLIQFQNELTLKLDKAFEKSNTWNSVLKGTEPHFDALLQTVNMMNEFRSTLFKYNQNVYS